MFYRVLWLVVFFLNALPSFAMEGENLDNKDFSRPLKRFKAEKELPKPEVELPLESQAFKGQCYQTPPRTPQKVHTRSPKIIHGCSPEGKFWSPYKNQLALTLTPDSPFVRRIYKRSSLESFFSCMTFKGKTVYYNHDLFSPHDLVLSDKGIRETNLQRMKRGCSPVGLKGIVPQEEFSRLTQSEILKKQRTDKLEVQHMLQTDDSILCVMTKKHHMSYYTNFIVETKPETGETRIIYKNLTLDEAEKRVKESPNYVIRKNVLHFRKEPSRINRPAFNAWRTHFWQEYARILEEGQKPLFLTTPPFSIEEELDLASRPQMVLEQENFL